jgi:hypothetical protein
VVQLTVFSCDFTGISVPENTQQLLVIHEIFRNQDGTTFLHRSRQLPKDACPRLAGQVVRSYGFPAQGTNRWVLLVEVVDSRCGFTEEFTSSVANQLVDGRGDESDDVRAALEVL